MHADTTPATRPGIYRWYVLAVLLLAYISAFVDRTILGLLVEPIKQDLHASDVELSLLSGFAFALFYTLLGLPCGWLADRVQRPRLIFFGILFWSAATAACGLARSFVQLFLARVGVGIGEATLTPATYSLLPDYFRREELGVATGIYASGVSIGGGIAMLVGGAAVHALQAKGDILVPLLGLLRPWQSAFVVVGLAGLLVALLILTIREPGRSGRTKADAPGFLIVLRWIIEERRAVLPILFGYSLMVIPSYALVTWVPAFLMRSHGLGPGETGLAMGLMLLIGGTAGMLVGGAA
ncbi:MAG TPA: MFS transporter, partial [Chakrabartia sp.]|nr:MFS transporter [Chakrabartia sp.]